VCATSPQAHLLEQWPDVRCSEVLLFTVVYCVTSAEWWDIICVTVPIVL